MDSEEKTSSSNEKDLPEMSIGLIGHVDHGKTTLTERLSGKWTDTHSEEIKRGITIRLGYADTMFYKCSSCPSHEAYGTSKVCKNCGAECMALRKVSFVDAPGHESLMATMLCGANIMDSALLIVAANEECPQPQTSEHLMALKIVNISNIVVIQNKIDLVNREEAIKNYAQIKNFLKGTPYENAPIIPVSAKYNVNTDFIISAIVEFIKAPKRDLETEPLMFVARSFDINRPGTSVESLKGGVLGGVLRQGKLAVGMEIEIRPGYLVEEKNQKIMRPLKTKIVSIMAGNTQLEEVTPGGSFGILTILDPSIVKSDSLTGSVVGKPGMLPETRYELVLEQKLLNRVVGSKEDLEVEPIKLGEPLMLNVNSSATVGIVSEISKNQFKCSLKLPVCAEQGSRVAISRRIGTRFRLIGYGILKK